MDLVRNSDRGYTFLELLIVVLIALGLSGIAWVNLSEVYNQDLLVREVQRMESEFCRYRDLTYQELSQRRIRFYKSYGEEGRSCYLVQKNVDGRWKSESRHFFPKGIVISQVNFSNRKHVEYLNFMGGFFYSGHIEISNKEGYRSLIFYRTGRIRIE